RLVLAHPNYFKAAWAEPLYEHATKADDFHVAAGQKDKVPLMHRRGGYKYFQDGNCQLVGKPYRGHRQSMLIFPPGQGEDLAVFEKTLTGKNLDQWLSQMKEHQVEVFLPRFKVTQEFQLNGTLAALGMPQAFGRTADFSGMNGRKDLFIQAVVHKAYVDVNEKGTEAAAATGVAVGAKSAPPRPTHTFRADRPFVFAIRDNSTGSLLFLGRVTNPQP